MFGFGSSKKQKKPSLFKRLIYLVVLMSSGGGVAGWSLKDYPQVQSLLSALTGEDAATLDSLDAKTVEAKVASAMVDVIKKKVGNDFSRPGVYQVSILRVKLDPAGFKAGHTVDIQAKVMKLDPKGRDVTLWESKPFGERLAVVGKDELTAGWPHRLFQVSWSPGDQVVVEVSDHRGGFFVQPKRYALAPPGPQSRDFPLKSGTFSLIPLRMADSAPGSKGNQIDFASQRIGELGEKISTQVAERPIVIK